MYALQFFMYCFAVSEQVTMPTPIPPEDIEGMLKKVREEEEDLERLKNIAKQEREMMRAAKEAEKTKEAHVAVATVGSNVRIRNGPYVNFEGFISDLTDDKKVHFLKSLLCSLFFTSLK